MYELLWICNAVQVKPSERGVAFSGENGPNQEPVNKYVAFDDHG
jgi:hypothetical protein